MTSTQFTWINFYEELANKLLTYRSRRADLIGKLISAYEAIGMRLPTLDSLPVPADIDPYTVYGLFNKGITESKRKQIIAAIAEALSIEALHPDDFDGIPILNNRNATFYPFSDDNRRGEHDIDNLWRVFEAEIALAANGTAENRAAFIEAFNATAVQPFIRWKLTEGLYWARPRSFISLDSRNRWFMGDAAMAGAAIASVVPHEKDSPIHDGERYLAICDAIHSELGTDACPYVDFPMLSHAAFVESERVNKEEKSAKKAAEKEAEENSLDDAADEAVPDSPEYDKDQFLSEVYMSEKHYDTLVGVLRSKKNIILQGAPGVGKTFVAKRLAYSMMGVKDPERVMMVQFHQSYSYEDFIEGYRPSGDGFELEKGAFYTFCKKAAEDEENEYFFIIDEINRGNLSKIFGELFMLIENDKRGPKNKLQLLYSRELFHVPSNVYLIGMMNTADRSLAMLDYALRRRFAFFDLKPGFDSDGFVAYRDGLGSAKLNDLLACVARLNKAIAADETLGDGFCVGHSYFCGMKTDDVTGGKLSAIVEYELVPLLREYWFDEPSKVWEWVDAMRRAIK